ncbi:MAG: DEAD/DEAH box helicase [Chloroflexi bacterium]|nr:DEAD/DEAH box helicase [Chloroflexota bacterium]
MTPSEFLAALRAAPGYAQQIVHQVTLPARPAVYRALASPLPALLQERLHQLGIAQLWSHQAEAVDAARRGEHVIVATSTASGKSLCYHLPVIEALLADPSTRALYLFPTKALAQDQLRALRRLAPECRAATFDGDTPLPDRRQVRERAQIILTNPDMLHLGILPAHASWGPFFRHLRFVVIDEAHSYRGVFGSHVANVLRRLRRICAAAGSRPVFLATSATIGNPGEHLERLVGEPATVVAADGSPHGPRQLVFWNPPLLGEALAGCRSANAEAAALLAALVRARLRTIVFTRTRKLAELVAVYARERLRRDGDLADRIAVYRAGYLPAERREIERRLFNGELLAVVATTALELGIDVGDLTAAVLTGYPGSVASTWQQAGRAGRGEDESLVVLIGLDNPLDQYLMRHPDHLLTAPREHAWINPENPTILASHLLCAAHELPLGAEDLALFGEGLLGALGSLAAAGYLRQQGDYWFPTAIVSAPARAVNIRAGSEEPVTLLVGGQPLETVEATLAPLQLHPGAVYLHQGESYLVETLDLAARLARARPVDLPYYTVADEQTDLRIQHVSQTRPAGRTTAFLGEVAIRSQVVGFKRKRIFSEEVLSREPLALPPQQFTTAACWWTLPATLRAPLERQGGEFAGGLHAAEHACIGLLPLFALCDRRDIGGVSTPLHPDTGLPTIFIYDGHPGGVGIAERGYAELEALWTTTLQVLRDCPCQDGCPSCIQSPKCGNLNATLDKHAATWLLEWLLGEQAER